MKRYWLIVLLPLLVFLVQCKRAPKQPEQMVTIRFSPGVSADGMVRSSALPSGFFCYAIGVDLEEEPIVTRTRHCNYGSTFPKMSAIYGPFTDSEVAQISLPTGNHELYLFASSNSGTCQPGATLTSPDFISLGSPSMLLEEFEANISPGTNDLTLTIVNPSGPTLSACQNGVEGVTNLPDGDFSAVD